MSVGFQLTPANNKGSQESDHVSNNATIAKLAATAALAILANTFVCDVLSDLRPQRRSYGMDCHGRSGAHTGPLLQ